MQSATKPLPRIPTLIELWNFAPLPEKHELDSNGRPMLIIAGKPAGWAMAALSRKFGHGEFDLVGATVAIGREQRRTYDMIAVALEHGLIEVTRSGRSNKKYYRVKEEE